MPLRSKAQRRWLWSQVAEGKISKEKAEEWERETPSKPLPERVKPKAKTGPKSRARKKPKP